MTTKIYLLLIGTNIVFGSATPSHIEMASWRGATETQMWWGAESALVAIDGAIDRPEATMTWDATRRVVIVNGVEFTEDPSGQYANQSAAIESDWPLLEAHPDPAEVPDSGLLYRLTGSPVTFWVARQNDLVSTQLSAHDADGRAILRSRRLTTGIETTIPVEEQSTRIAEETTLQDIRLYLRTTNKVAIADVRTNAAAATAVAGVLKGDAVTNRDAFQAISVNSSSTTTQVRSAVIALQAADVEQARIVREQADALKAQAQLIRDLAAAVNDLRRKVIEITNAEDAP